MPARGHKPGHEAASGAALVWSTYIDGLIADHGSLVAVCEKLAAVRGYKHDVESIGRALRRLRARGAQSGGTWGERLLVTFGLPTDVDARLRFMGLYHSRFVDLPVPLAADLIALWDRAPVSDSRAGRTWLSLARATLALRTDAVADAAMHFDTAAATAGDDVRMQLELALGTAWLASRPEPARVPAQLDAVPDLLERARSCDDADCFRARHVGQVSHALNRAGDLARGLALHEALPDGAETHPFARSRRANGIAYGQFRLGDHERALVSARRAATFAGDAGHIRLRAMALLMVGRIGGHTDEAVAARQRARGIAVALADQRLLGRCDAADRDHVR